MIVPSIDLIDARAVQLRQGREMVLDGGDPLERLAEFAVAGEVAIVDLDAALGQGSNSELIREMVRRAPCRVGGGIRDVDSARAWLDAGATQVVLGTAATVEICRQLPRERVIAAVDCRGGSVVVEGWTRSTGVDPIAKIEELTPWVGGFLLTQVEHEGGMGGFDRSLVERVVAASGEARITAAGGIATVDDVADLDRLGADAQVGMALYTGRMVLGEAVAAALRNGIDQDPDLGSDPESGPNSDPDSDPDSDQDQDQDQDTDQSPGPLWPTVVVDDHGASLGLVWSSRESVAEAVRRRRGIYWSRSRRELWVKGETSGARQELLRVDLDCDRDALRFTVRQQGDGFCHTGTRSCWNEAVGLGFDLNLGSLEQVILDRQRTAEPGSGTAKLLNDPQLLAAKLREEAEELVGAETAEEGVHEAADLLYFLLVSLIGRGGRWSDVRRELARRHGAVGRRPMEAKLVEVRTSETKDEGR